MGAEALPAKLVVPPTLTWSVCLLAVLATGVVLALSRPFLLPIVLAALLHVVVSPIVRSLRRWHIPPPATAVLMLAMAISAITAAVYYLADPTREWLETLPQQLLEVRTDMRTTIEDVEKVEEAANSIGEMTDMGGDDGAMEVASVDRSPVLSGAASFFAQTFATLFLLFVMIAGQGSFMRSLVKALPTFQGKRLAVRLVRSFSVDVSAYLLTITLINLGLGCAIGIAMWLLGLPNPILWGVMATVLNYVPYAGAVVGILVIGLAATAEFDGFSRPLAAMSTYAALTSLEGGLVTPMIVGRQRRIRPVAVLIWLLTCGFLWGIPGALIAIPILIVVKVVCEHVPRLAPLAVLLGGRPVSSRRPGEGQLQHAPPPVR